MLTYQDSALLLKLHAIISTPVSLFPEAVICCPCVLLLCLALGMAHHRNLVMDWDFLPTQRTHQNWNYILAPTGCPSPGSVAKKIPAESGDVGDLGLTPQVFLRVRKSLWRRKWQPSPVFLSEKSHGQRSLVGYSPWGHKEADTTKQLNTHTTAAQVRW